MQRSDVFDFIKELNSFQEYDDKFDYFNSREDVIDWVAEEDETDFIEAISDAFEVHGRKDYIKKRFLAKVKAKKADKRNGRLGKFSAVDPSKLVISRTGEIAFTPANVEQMLLQMHDVKFIWDDFTKRSYMNNILWDAHTPQVKFPLCDDSYSLHPYEDEYNSMKMRITLNGPFPTEKEFTNVDKIVATAARANVIDAATKWLMSHKGKWDGIDRIGSAETCWPVTIFKCEVHKWATVFARVLPLALIHRILQPGCELRYFFAIEGSQNVGKSKFCKRIVPEQWMGVGAIEKDSNEEKLSNQFHSKLVIELSEKGGMEKASQDMQKRFLTNTMYSWRPPYDRHYMDVPRRNIFVSTTNNAHFLNDPTGNTRCLPITSLRKENEFIDFEVFDAVWRQILAQALQMYDDGTRPILSSEEMAMQTEQTSKHDMVETSVEASIVEDYFNEEHKLDAAKQDGVCLEQLYEYMFSHYSITKDRAVQKQNNLKRALFAYGFEVPTDVKQNVKRFKELGGKPCRYFTWKEK